ncbi:hypothetical protein ACH5RR_029720, partial [Cinchona calisaya]
SNDSIHEGTLPMQTTSRHDTALQVDVVLRSCDQFLHLWINHEDWSSSLKVTFEYARSTPAERRDFWDSLCLIGANMVDPWVVGKDFNAIESL